MQIDPSNDEFFHHDGFISYSVTNCIVEAQSRLELQSSPTQPLFFTDQSTKAQKGKAHLNSSLLPQNVTLFGDGVFIEIIKLK